MEPASRQPEVTVLLARARDGDAQALGAAGRVVPAALIKAKKQATPRAGNSGRQSPPGGGPWQGVSAKKPDPDQNVWRMPTPMPVCEPPAAGVPPAAALLTDSASVPSLEMWPAVAYTAVRLDRW